MTQAQLRLYFCLLQKTSSHPKILFRNSSASVLKMVECFPSTALSVVWSTEQLFGNDVPLVLFSGVQPKLSDSRFIPVYIHAKTKISSSFTFPSRAVTFLTHYRFSRINVPP